MTALSHFAQIKRLFVFSLAQNDRSNIFSEVQIVEVSFGHLWWNLKSFSKNWRSFLSNLNSALHSASLMFNIQVKAIILVIWRIGVFRQKLFVLKQEFFIANKISVVLKDEEKMELFKRSHATIKIFAANYSTK